MWDPGKLRANVAKHGIEFADAALALEDPFALTRADPDARVDERFVTLGAAPDGRLLVVAWTLRGENVRLTHLSPAGYYPRTPAIRGAVMRKQYDFGKAKRGPVVRVPRGKARITIRLDEDVLEWFRKQVNDAGGGNYQTLINSALHEYIEQRRQPLEETLRRVLREELKRASQTGHAAKALPTRLIATTSSRSS